MKNSAQLPSIILSIFLWGFTGALLLIWVPAFLIQGWHSDLIFRQGLYGGYPANLHSRTAVAIAALFLIIFTMRGQWYEWFFPVLMAALGVAALMKTHIWFYGILTLVLSVILFREWPASAANKRVRFWSGYLLQTAVLSGITGGLFLVFSEMDHRPYIFETGKSLVFNGFVLLSFPALFLWTDKTRPEDHFYGLPSFASGAALVLYLLSFLGELWIFAGSLSRLEFHIPGFLRFLAFLIWIAALFPLKERIRSLPDPKAAFYTIFTLSLALGPLGHSLMQDFRGHFSHIAFTAGLMPIILLLSLKFFLPPEKQTSFIPPVHLLVVFALILIAAPLRIMAGMSDLTDLTELLGAALILASAAGIFGFYFFRSFFSQKQEK